MLILMFCFFIVAAYLLGRMHEEYDHYDEWFPDIDEEKFRGKE